jgi:hypothetical protein
VAVAVNIPDVGFQVFRPVIVKGRLLWHSRGISWCGKVRFPAGKIGRAIEIELLNFGTTFWKSSFFFQATPIS